MTKSLLAFLGILLVVATIVVIRKQHRDGVLKEARRASVALAVAREEVRFKWEFESCPPENAAVYAEWTRRLADAKASLTQTGDALGVADPDVQLFSAAISNQVFSLAARHVECLKKQGMALDRLRLARERAARSAIRRYACVSDEECGTP